MVDFPAKIDTFYFDEGFVRFFESGNVQAMADAIEEVINNPTARHNWGASRKNYINVVDLLSGWQQGKPVLVAKHMDRACEK